MKLAKKYRYILIAVILLLATGAGLYFFKGSHEQKTAKQFEDQTQRITKTACEILAKETAATVLGINVETDEEQAPASSSDDIEVTNCSYTEAGYSGSADKRRIVAVTVRKAKNGDGASANADVFKPANRPAASEEVSGYGESAFWNKEFGQLNILKQGNWYIVESGPVLPSGRNLDDTKKAADALVKNL